MANAGMKVSNTGAIGVYLVRGASQSVRSGQTGGATYYPLGTCDTFPRLATGTPLAPVVTDLFGSTPFDHYHGGMVGTIAMNLNRFSWINLLALVQGDMTAISAANAAAAETGTGFFTVGKHGLRIGRNDTTACGLLFLYSGAAGSRPAGEAGDVANQLIGRVYHSVGLRALNITSMGTRAFSVALDLVPVQGIINSRIEMFRNLLLHLLGQVLQPTLRLLILSIQALLACMVQLLRLIQEPITQLAIVQIFLRFQLKEI